MTYENDRYSCAAGIEQNKVICMYHASCMDGMAAVVVVSWKYPDAEFYALDYGDEFPCHISPWDTVIAVDFSFSKERMDELCDLSGRLVFLDHHKGSQATAEYLLDRQARAHPDAPIKAQVPT